MNIAEALLSIFDFRKSGCNAVDCDNDNVKVFSVAEENMKLGKMKEIAEVRLCECHKDLAAKTAKELNDKFYGDFKIIRFLER